MKELLDRLENYDDIGIDKEVVIIVKKEVPCLTSITKGLSVIGDPNIVWRQVGTRDNEALNIGINKNTRKIVRISYLDIKSTNEKVRYNLIERLIKTFNPRAADIRQLRRWALTKIDTKKLIKVSEDLWLQANLFQILFKVDDKIYCATCDTIKHSNTFI